MGRVQLEHKIDIGEGKELSYLDVGMFKVKHIPLIPDEYRKGNNKNKVSDPAKMIPLMAKLCNLDDKTFGELSIEDFQKVASEVEASMGKIVPR